MALLDLFQKTDQTRKVCRVIEVKKKEKGLRGLDSTMDLNPGKNRLVPRSHIAFERQKKIRDGKMSVLLFPEAVGFRPPCFEIFLLLLFVLQPDCFEVILAQFSGSPDQIAEIIEIVLQINSFRLIGKNVVVEILLDSQTGISQKGTVSRDPIFERIGIRSEHESGVQNRLPFFIPKRVGWCDSGGVRAVGPVVEFQ
ncbi:MAG: hypothetical protein ACLFSZ_00315 [Puniceicoccaceae bacterium]